MSRPILLDTCVISELVRPRPDPAVLAWFEAQRDEDLYLSVLTPGEIERGATKLPHGPQRERIEDWLGELLEHFEERLIDLDVDTALRWGDLTARAAAQGVQVPVIDGLLAATALRRDLRLATRNTADFEALGVALVNPWERGKRIDRAADPR